jgi:hypothetical protein
MTLPTSSTPRFRATFNLGVTNELTIADLITTGYAMTVKALFSITDPDGLLFYQNAGYLTEDFSAADFDSTTPVWSVSGIDLPLDADGIMIKRGTYTFNAIYRLASTNFLVTKTYNLKYVAPTVEITLTANCRTSELTYTDITDYSDIGESVPTTTTISRSRTITKPAKSGANDPGTVVTTTVSDTATIGGGITSATRLWTRTWQVNIVTTLQYDMEAWGLYNWIVIQDIVYGDDSINVQCSDCACTLNTCWENLITRWKDAESNHAVNVSSLRYKVLLGAALWDDFYNLERCGEDTYDKCLEIRELLNSTDCSCPSSADDTVSTVIVPWGAGSSSVSASTFRFTVSATDPTPGSGNANDVHYNNSTYHLWNNSSGTWVDNGSLQGATGSSGAAATQKVVFYNNNANVGTSAGTTLELLDHILLATPILYAVGDCIYIKTVYELAINDNGKTSSLYLNATSIASHFTDSAVNTSNNIVTIEAWITVTGTNTQTIETLVTRGGNVYPGYTTGTFTTATGITVNVYGQNTVATLNDIICRMLRVEVKNKI